MRARGIIIAAALLAGVCALAPALAVNELDVNVGLLFIGSSPPPGYGAPSPLLQSFGVSLPMRLSGNFFLEPSIEFFGTYYEWTGSRAVPATYESGIGFFTVGSLLTLQAGLLFPVGKAVELGGAVGADLLIRFPFEFQNTNTNSGQGVSYFYTMGRFFYPETRFITRWNVTEGVTLIFTLRGMYPLFHLWDGENLPFYDQLLTALDLGFAISLGGKPGPEKPAAAAPAAPAAPSR